MTNAAELRAAAKQADAEVQRHKRESKRHRLAARDWAAKRAVLIARCEEMGLGLTFEPDPLD